MKLEAMWIVAFILLHFIVFAVNGQDCLSLAVQGDCSFYRQCVEARIRCGDGGYAISYGERYCNRFQNNKDCFNSGGQSWITGARSCLMLEILNSDIYLNNGSCSELFDFAFASHPKCYTDNGFCTEILPSLLHWGCLYNVFSLSDLFTKNGRAQILETGKRCTQDLVDTFLNDVTTWLRDATGGLRDLLKTMKDLLGSCTSGLDLLVVMDSSGSIGSSNFQTAKNFVSNLAKAFLNGQNSSRVGVVTFSSSASVQIPLGSILDSNKLVNAINSIPYTEGGTNTHLALDLLVEIFMENSREDQGIPRVAILLTDGQSNHESLTIAAANRVHNTNIQVYSFGIGSNTNSDELLTIASDANYVYHIDNFAAGSFAAELRPLQLTACTTPAITDISENIVNTIAKDQSQYLQYDFPIGEGFTILVDISSGELIIYGSFSIRSPTSLTADFQVQGRNSIQYYISPVLYNASVYTGIDTEESRRKRQALTEENRNVYLAVVGVEDSNVFSLNTTLGDATDHAVAVVGGLLTVVVIAVSGLMIIL